MTRALSILFLLVATWVGAQPSAAPAEGKRFITVDVFVDSKDRPLAAYQVQFNALGGDAKVVGIEGGEPAAFREAPYYDPKAMEQERVVIAAFSTVKAGALPKGRIRVATIHLQVAGNVQPEFTVKLTASARVNGRKISAVATVTERKGS